MPEPGRHISGKPWSGIIASRFFAVSGFVRDLSEVKCILQIFLQELIAVEESRASVGFAAGMGEKRIERIAGVPEQSLRVDLRRSADSALVAVPGHLPGLSWRVTGKRES